LKNLEGEASSLNNIGSIHNEMGDFQEALKYFKQALEIAEKAGFKKLITTTQQNIEKTKSKMQK
jgi:tetratricopeptide (TPR) repeat protein